MFTLISEHASLIFIEFQIEKMLKFKPARR